MSTPRQPWLDEPTPVRIVRIRLGTERPVEHPDPLGRSLIGYAPGLTPAELWRRGRGVWRANWDNISSAQLAVLVHDRVVVGVGTVEAIEPAGGRVAVVGRPLEGHPLIGQPDPLDNTSRMPLMYGEVTTVLPNPDAQRTYADVLRDAIAVLSEASRLRQSVLRPVEAPEGDRDVRNAQWEVDPDRTTPSDWAEFVTLALAGATANAGGIDAALNGRPGSWEAAGVRSLLESTIGPDEHDLWRHRTEPLAITLYVEDLVSEQTRMWEGYATAEREIQTMIEDAEAANPQVDLETFNWIYRRTVDVAGETPVIGPWEPVDPTAPAWTIEAWRAANPDINPESRAFWERMILGEEMSTTGIPVDQTWLPRSPELAAEYNRLEREREARLNPVYALEEQLEEQRLREVVAYGQALKERVETAARALPGLAVPVLVDVNLTWSAHLNRHDDMPNSVERLVEQALTNTPAPEDLPGTPLTRLLEASNHQS